MKGCIEISRRQSEIYDEMYALIVKTGGEVLSKEYKNYKTPIEFICCCGSNSSATATQLRRSGGYCSNCRYIRSRNKLNLSYKDVETTFAEYNCRLLTNNYKNTRQKLKYVCSCGRDAEDTFNQFRRHFICGKCVKEISLQEKKIVYYNKTKDYAEVNGCTLLTTLEEYEGVRGWVRFICSECGKNAEKRLQNFYNNPICNSCLIKEQGAERALKYREIKSFIEDNNCKLITEEIDYQDSTTLLKLMCSCGKEFNTTFAYFKHESKKQCNECGIKLRSGEKSPFWKGGVSSERDKIKQSEDYIKWRQDVYERDSYTCQCCGDDAGGNLHAHHIINFSENKGLRFDTDNGITLCNNCHNPSIYGSFHNTYGTRNNTREQLEEYIEWYKEDVYKIINV